MSEHRYLLAPPRGVRSFCFSLINEWVPVYGTGAPEPPRLLARRVDAIVIFTDGREFRIAGRMHADSWDVFCHQWPMKVLYRGAYDEEAIVEALLTIVGRPKP